LQCLDDRHSGLPETEKLVRFVCGNARFVLISFFSGERLSFLVFQLPVRWWYDDHVMIKIPFPANRFPPGLLDVAGQILRFGWTNICDRAQFSGGGHGLGRWRKLKDRNFFCTCVFFDRPWASELIY
jgi:hypothetical protein